MKHLSQFALIFLLLSCSGKEQSESSKSENVLENLTYSVDTVMVDAGDEVINLRHGARFSAVSLDAQRYYYYDYNKIAINEIDLQTLEVTDIYQFSKEGPNSIGFNLPNIQPLRNSRFFFASSANVGIYSNSGEKEKSLKFNFKEIDGLDIDEGGLITNQAKISHDGKLMFALSSPYHTPTDVRVIIVEPEIKKGKTISLPNFIPTLKFKVHLKEEKRVMGVREGVQLNILNNVILITSSSTSDTYIYDYQIDSLRLIEFPHQLVSLKKSGEIKNEVGDENEFYAEWAKFKYQISFDKFLWDEERQQYFRFGYQLIPHEDRELEKKSEVFLFAYDKNLNLIGETQLDEIEYRFESPFFKDGKLWSYVNVEDELGFAIFTFDF
ncbi:DUF4221 family protein [Algoriphagus vanfongensis]|uniref:DUF4221 family protein n=1 Tax=Algoriphagus vanfongensis TaxID=426371 RepID=UPI00040FD4E9|nr:DUF4221 family protein [Algoriphagus vanfongensis]